jgi:hypothetical protein
LKCSGTFLSANHYWFEGILDRKMEDFIHLEWRIGIKESGGSFTIVTVS